MGSVRVTDVQGKASRKIIITLKYGLFLISLVWILHAVPVSFAHELLSKEVVQFIKDNPTATPEEISAFGEKQNAETSQKLIPLPTQDTLRTLRGPERGLFHYSIDFVRLGVVHILAGPDHILFVVSLVLVFVSIAQTFKLATAFTIAHSITLILAGSNILVLSSSIVEPLIALSIVVMAILPTFFGSLKIMVHQRMKIGLVFFFGLFHGLGFAGLLKEITIPDDKFILSLLSFNVGIEVGQLVIITLLLPLVFYLRNKPWHIQAVKMSAVIISLPALFWFFKRISFLW